MAKAENDLVQRYFDGELDAGARARFEAEMTDEDRERLAALGEMHALLNGVLDAEAGAVDIWSGVGRELARQNQKQKAHRAWLSRRSVSGAASVFLAAAAALIVLIHPWHPSHPSNGCDVETLEVGNGYATVMQVQDSPHDGDGSTTIIWAEED